MIRGYAYRSDRPNTPYRVVMNINRHKTYIGSFQTPEEAVEAYRKARAEHPELPKNGGRKKGSKYVYRKNKKKRKPIQRTPWKDEDKETLLRLLNTTDLSYKGIGKVLGRTELSIQHMLRRLRLGQ